MTTTVSVTLADAASEAAESAAESIEAQLRWLDSLARTAGPAARDDDTFVQHHHALRQSLRALRGGLKA